MRGGGVVAGLAAAGAAGLGYRMLVGGQLTMDTGWGRSVRPLGPFGVSVDAPRDVVFDVIAGPYLERTPRAMAEKIDILERGTDMVLAAHRTPVRTGMVAVTVETVRFHRPERVEFRLVRGPVPFVAEQFLLTEEGAGTRLAYSGELGTDFWAVGRWWAGRVGGVWETTVRASFAAVKAEAERRARGSGGPRGSRMADEG